MPTPRDDEGYPSPFTSVLRIDDAWYVITERETTGFFAALMTDEERALAIRALDDAHADIEARIVGMRARGARR